MDLMELMIWGTIVVLSGGIFNTIRRMFTLPKRYNSLSDIARDPLGALKNAAQWAVPMMLAGGVPGLTASLKGLFNPATLKSIFSMKGLSTALPLASAGLNAMATIEQQKAMREQQRLAEREARRAEALANQAAAQQALLQSMPGTTPSSAANVPVDMATLFASPTAGMPQPTSFVGPGAGNIAQLLNLSEDDLRELIRRSGSRMA